jgi:hypothetical protein
MSEAYTKLMHSIVQSTVWSEPLATKVVWITMLALSDRDGNVWASIPGLAKTAGVTIEECEAALKRFHEPDTYSRTKEFDGRRIVTVDRGWTILTYKMHRDSMSAEAVREAKREWWHRNKPSKLDGTRSDEKNLEQVDVDVDVDKDKSVARTRARTRKTAMPDGFEISEKVKSWAEENGLSHLLEPNFKRFVSYAKAKGAMYANWDQALKNAVSDNWVGNGKPAQPQASVRVCAYCTAKSVGSANRYEHCFAHKGRALDNEPPQKAKT